MQNTFLFLSKNRKVFTDAGVSKIEKIEKSSEVD